ncbi:hypothetical protein TrVE_jg6239 [Triparma verrucosa]|uniref:Uncharacterized protein n=1 Tax=Triparma verrucosa TaxID=1606542 RepID=A0A9W7BFX9_9STRA|nr:hypothetical protein TrVE_jg6239 [Triparma verrucosa]
MAHNISPEGSKSAQDFFHGTEGLIATYEFNYQEIIEFKTKVAESETLSLFPCSCIFCCIPFHYCFEEENIRDDISSQYVCLTQDGIKYVKDRHKTGCRYDHEDAGKTTKTIPYDKITDCDIEEPAGAEGPCCCMVDRVLTTVNIDTASGSRGDGEGNEKHELSLVGLKDPEAFKAKVWQLKREGVGFAAQHIGSAVTQVPSMIRSADGDAGASNELAPLLWEQNKLLGDTNRLLQEIAKNTKK